MSTTVGGDGSARAVDSPGAAKQYWRILAPSRRRVAVVAFSALAAGLLEAAGIASLVSSLGATDATRSEVYIGLLVLALFLVASVVSRAISETQALALNVEIEARLRTTFLEQLLDARWAAIRETSSGDLVTALLSESSQVANGAGAFVAMVSALLIAGCLGVAALLVAPLLAVASLGFAVVSFVAYRRVGRLSRANQAELAKSASSVNDEAVALLGNAKMLLSSGERREWQTDIQAMLRTYMGLRRRDLQLPIRARSVVEVFGAGFLVLTMAAAVANGQPVSSALLTMALFYRVIPRLQSAQSSYLVARTQLVWLSRWHDRRSRWSIASGSRPSGSAGTRTFDPPMRTLELRSVTVQYPTRSAPALSGLDLELTPGLVVAVVGRTGSGKSTLLDLLTGLTDPTDGVVLLNGEPLRSWDLDSWQRRVGLVPQDPAITASSIRDNIVWLGQAEDAGKVVDAAADAVLTEFINSLPNGIDTLVGPRAGFLSGGQRQRIALARALYRNPDLLILDEATSALDQDTERTVLANVRRRLRTGSVVLVTHRLATLEVADFVIVLDNGRVVASGRPEEAVSAARTALLQMQGETD